MRTRARAGVDCRTCGCARRRLTCRRGGESTGVDQGPITGGCPAGILGRDLVECGRLRDRVASLAAGAVGVGRSHARRRPPAQRPGASRRRGSGLERFAWAACVVALRPSGRRHAQGARRGWKWPPPGRSTSRRSRISWPLPGTRLSGGDWGDPRSTTPPTPLSGTPATSTPPTSPGRACFPQIALMPPLSSSTHFLDRRRRRRRSAWGPRPSSRGQRHSSRSQASCCMWRRSPAGFVVDAASSASLHVTHGERRGIHLGLGVRCPAGSRWVCPPRGVALLSISPRSGRFDGRGRRRASRSQ